MKIKGYIQVSFDIWRKDSNLDTLHIIRQYFDNGSLCKEVTYYIKE
jgi:hypothetical protein